MTDFSENFTAMSNYIEASKIHEFLDLLYARYQIKKTVSNKKGLELSAQISLLLTKTNNKKEPRYKFDAKHEKDKTTAKKMFDSLEPGLGKKNSKFEWKALVRFATNGKYKKLPRTRSDLEGLVISPKGSINVNEPTKDPRMTVIDEWPVIEVCGISKSSSELNCKRLAMQTLHRLCSFISVVHWAETVVVAEPVKVDIEFPHELIQSDNYEAVDGKGLKLLWRNIGKDECAYRAASLFREAIAICADHKSLSHLALISAIETIGSKIHPATVCAGIEGDKTAHCENCQSPSGARQAFLAALDLVCDPATKKIADDYSYKLRSGFVHTGRLHGGETLSPEGSLFLPYSSYFDGHVFGHALYDLMNIVRTILIESKFRFPDGKSL